VSQISGVYVIHTQKLAGYLMQLGFSLQKLEPDKRDLKRNLFVFKDSDGLRQAIKSYKK
jgi:hypothetical protein